MDSNQFLGRGWKFPPEFSRTTRQVLMNESVANINQSINLIFQTQQGERSFQPYFGSNLRSYMFRTWDATLKKEIEQSVFQTLLNDEPRIDVDHVDVQFQTEPEDMVLINVHYTIRQTNSRHNHVFPFSIIEGTNLTLEQKGADSRG